MRSRKFMAIALAAVTMGTLAAFASCGSDKTTVTLSGSTSVQPLMEKLGAALAAWAFPIRRRIKTISAWRLAS